ncbi:MAG TPA: glutamate racemase [Patescibacteria group bacterium]|nr:glutamate racemase [Patescibacteria group bacterium]
MSTKNNNNKIGIFDSGLGGLTVLRHLLSTLPGYHYIYLGDTARVPYGEKSPATIYEYSTQAMDFLLSQGCNLIIIACNTASAQALRPLQQKYLPNKYPNRRILGVIRPLAEEFSNKNIKCLGVIGTKSTIKSNAYKTEINKLNPNIKIEAKSTPLLVPLIEESWGSKPETKMILKKYLRPLKIKRVEALILACTHYPFLLKQIRKIMGQRVIVPDPGEIVAASLKKYLKSHPELNIVKKEKTNTTFFTTDDPFNFKQAGEKFLQKPIEKITKVKID